MADGRRYITHVTANGLTKIQVSEEMLYSNYTALLG